MDDRPREALELLRADPDPPAERLAAATTAAGGFANPSHFSTAFHATFGLSRSSLLATPVKIRVPTPLNDRRL
ncbi:hypothetical protein [Saccharopolyspora spinosa]|uniref:HTH araC/xylS-type domain-containing protein n=1 Tax=Saccharopolyspora spinosa TaxID=60894 RepID=A0A2N3Y996_SACSN|nr:hypothetical protein [Saccharopolyspora spinosa]PKW19497.1 hypothetical protein A8926_7668 [Saccharopolyspora spinosa]